MRNCFPYFLRESFGPVNSTLFLLFTTIVIYSFLLIIYFGNLWIEITTTATAIRLATNPLWYRTLQHLSKSASHLSSEHAGRVCRTVLTSNSLGLLFVLFCKTTLCTTVIKIIKMYPKFSQLFSRLLEVAWVKVYRIIPEFRILRLTFHRKTASKC